MPVFEPSAELPAATGAVEVDDSRTQFENARQPSIPLDPLAGPDGGQKSRRLAKYWLGQIDKVDDEQKKWVKRGKSIEKRYRDERNRVDEEGQRRTNNLWANVQILLPALYGRSPVPIVERRFSDKDEIGRGASQIIERALRNELELNDYHDSVTSCVMDYLLPGRGAVWVRYEPQFGPSISIPVDSQSDLRDEQGDIEDEREDEEEEKIEDTGSRLIRESVPVDYVSWLDFYMFPAKARTWKEVRAVGKRVYMSRDEMKERFGDEIGKAIPLQSEDREKRNQSEQRRAEDELDAKGEIFEIWDKDTLDVVWVGREYDFIADRKPDPLDLENFFPTARPLTANATNNTIIPVPDFAQYQDQAVMLDELTQRTSQLAKACKVAGLYNAASEEISRLLDESVENELIPVDNWQAFSEKGGIAGQISLLPLKEIIGVLQELVAVKQMTQAELDRLSGIPDVLRGTMDSRETLGGQRLKTNSAGTRLGYRQAEVARFARDVVRLCAEVMCKHFSPKSLIEASGALYEEGLGAPEVRALGFGETAEGDGPPTPSPQMPPAGPQPGAGASPPLAAGQQPQPQLPAPQPAAAPPQGMTPAMPPGGSPMARPPMPMPPPGQGMPSPMAGGPPGMAGQTPSDDDAGRMLRALMRIAKSIQLLRDDHVRGFRIDIEVDSTIYGDQAQEKADRVEFIGSITKFLQVAMTMGAQMPEATPLLAKLLQFGVRGFRVGRDLESAIEEFADQAVIGAKQRAAAAQSQPNPEQIKLQADTQRAQLDMAKTQAEGQQLQIKTQTEVQAAQIKARDDAAKAQAEVQSQQLDSQAEIMNSKADLQGKQMDYQMRMVELEIEKLRLQGELAKLQAPQPQQPVVNLQ